MAAIRPISSPSLVNLPDYTAFNHAWGGARFRKVKRGSREKERREEERGGDEALRRRGKGRRGDAGRKGETMRRRGERGRGDGATPGSISLSPRPSSP